MALHPKSIVRALALAALALVLANLAVQLARYLAGRDHLLGLVHLFSLNDEYNIPAFFSAGLLLYSSMLLLSIALREHRLGAKDVPRWMILSVGFLLMAIDETLSLHERLILPMREVLGSGNLGLLYFAWVIPGMALVLVLGLSFLTFLLRLPRRTALVFTVAATLYLGGALGIELIEGRHAEIHTQHNLGFHMLVMLEESLEMAGVIVFIHGLLHYLADRRPDLRRTQPAHALAPKQGYAVSSIGGNGTCREAQTVRSSSASSTET